MQSPNKIKHLFKTFPSEPGVYKFIDKEGKVIYVGKAKDIKKRVKQHFQNDSRISTRLQKLIENTEKVDFIVVDSELEAIILESTLIKQYMPKYNILMKDGKNFVYIKITKEDFPRIQLVRKIEKDGAKYIGPKTAAHKINTMFKILKKIFPFRHCNLGIESLGENKVKITKKTIKYPCLDFYIKRCSAPCMGKITKEEYREIIDGVENFLEGKADKILDSLYKMMELHAKNKDFEKAAKTRDKISQIKEILEKQKVSAVTGQNQDIINYVILRERAYFSLLQIRDGKLIDQENFILIAKDFEDNSYEPEVLESFVNQYYEMASDIPQEILLPHEIDGLNKDLKLTIPQKGIKDKLLEMALKNALIFADRNKPSWLEESEQTKDATKELQKFLKLKTPLKRIECYDISHLGGSETVGSMVVFINGVPDKEMYRKFKIRTLEDKPDDYKAMEETLTRRFMKIAQEFQHKDYIFRKITNKDKNSHSMYILKKGKKIVGSIGVKEYSQTVAELKNLFIATKERGKKLGYKLIKNAIIKTKAKRIYAMITPQFKEYYALIGFEETKKCPEEITEKNKICMLYDKTKHKADKSFEQIPDLIVIDGGMGQLSTTSKVLKKLELKIPHIALAKKFEEIYTDSKKPIILPNNNPILKLLQRARDEAHRFAVNYHHNLHSKKLIKK